MITLWCWKTILWMVWRRTRPEACTTIKSKLLSENWLEGFPGAPGVKESALQCWGHEFDPCSWKIPHASEQLSLWVTITEAWTPRARVLQQEKPLQWESLSPQVEKARAQQRRPNAAKIIQLTGSSRERCMTMPGVFKPVSSDFTPMEQKMRNWGLHGLTKSWDTTE